MYDFESKACKYDKFSLEEAAVLERFVIIKKYVFSQTSDGGKQLLVPFIDAVYMRNIDMHVALILPYISVYSLCVASKHHWKHTATRGRQQT